MEEQNKTTMFDLTENIEVQESYNPLDFIEGEDDEDWLDDSAHILPEALPPSEEVGRKRIAVFSPEHAGSAYDAVTNLITENPARRYLLLSILDWARDGISSTELFEKIKEAHAHNLSVYTPATYCKMLQRAGALEMTMPEVEDCEFQDNETTYMVIENEVEPIWTTNKEGLAAYKDMTQGNEWREIVLGSESVFANVYLAVMKLLAQTDGCSKEDVDNLTERFPLTRAIETKRTGAHFIDVLEATMAIRWVDKAWRLTDLGYKLLPELEKYCIENEDKMPPMDEEV